MSAQSEVGLQKCTMLNVGMLDISPLVSVLFYQSYLHSFYLKSFLWLYITHPSLLSMGIVSCQNISIVGYNFIII